MKRRALALGMMLSMLVGSTASAQDDDEEQIDPVRPGVYVAVGVGIAVDNFKNQVNLAESVATDIALGYRTGEYVSVEVEVEYLNGFDDDVTDRDEVDVWTATLNLRVHIPLGRLEPFITYGGGVMQAKGSGGVVGRFEKTDFVMKGGGGLEYHLTDGISLYGVVTYDWPISGVDGFEYTSAGLGLLYKF